MKALNRKQKESVYKERETIAMPLLRNVLMMMGVSHNRKNKEPSVLRGKSE